MDRSVLLFALSALLAPSLRAQAPNAPANAGWSETAASATAIKAGISVPLSAGTMKKTELRQFDKGGADLSARFESTDRSLQGTFFLSAPSLPDVGLRFLAIDEVLRRTWGPETHVTADKLIPIAGVKGAQRRVTYEGAKSGTTPLVNITIFVHAGPWVLVGWVTGPATRTDEIGKDLDAFLAGTTFAKASEPLAAKVIKTEPCAPRDRTVNAKGTRPGSAEAFALLEQPGVLNEKNIDPLQRTPDQLCLESVEVDGDLALQIYRADGPSDQPFAQRLFALFGSAGHVLEITESRKEPGSFYVLRHGPGGLYAFGKFDREPSIAQIRQLIVDPDSAHPYAVSTSEFASPNGKGDLSIYCGSIADCEDSKAAKPKP